MESTTTATALKRWSCSNKQLPDVQTIKKVHVYDFDNTLFLSPLPNKQLWHSSTYGALQSQEFLHNGGWWHNPDILAATGQGLAKEEAQGWKGCWNEKIVELAMMTTNDPEALGVLLTGRGEGRFADLLQRMLKAKGLSFDMVCLKPAVSPQGVRFASTLQFKHELLRKIMDTYHQAQEIRVYEDRPKHTRAFREFFEDINAKLAADPGNGRNPYVAEVIQVLEGESTMDPVAEVAEVQKMVNTHNQAVLDGRVPAGTSPYQLKRSVLFTGYLTSAADAQRLRNVAKSATHIPEDDVRWLGNNILIAPRPAAQHILQKAGGMGAKMRWRVVGVGSYERRVWALRVEPALPNSQVYTENRPPHIVVATAYPGKPIEATRIHRWQSLQQGQALEFDTTVGERVSLRIDAERPHEADAEGDDHVPQDGVYARKHARDEDFPPLGPSRTMSRPQQRSSYGGNNQAWNGSRGGGGIGFAASRAGRGGGSRGDRRRGGDRGGRGRGRGAYRSLDANVGQSYSPSAMEY